MATPPNRELSEQRFRSLVRATSHTVWIADPTGQHFTILEGVEQTFHGKSSYTLAESFELIHPEDQATILTKWQEAIRTVSVFESTQRVLRLEGWRTMQLKGVPVLDDSGQLVEWVGTSKDITDIIARQKTEDDLRASEARFVAFMDHSPAAAWITDKDGTFLYISGAYKRMFQLPTEDIIGKTVFDIYPHDIAQVYIENMRTVAHSGRTMETFEPGIRSDGSRGEFWVFKFPILSHGRTLIGGKAIDVTERRHAEVALRVSEQRFATFMEHCPAQTWINDEDGINRFANPALAHELRLPLEEIIGRHLAEIMPGVPITEYLESDKQVIESGKPFLSVVSAPRHDGTMGQFLIHKFPLGLSPNGRRQVGGMSIDVTEREQAISALREAEARLAIAVKAASVGLWDWNQETNEVAFSTEWKAQIGYAEHEITNTLEEWRSRVHPDDLNRTMQLVAHYLANPDTRYEAEFRFRHRNGAYRWILAQGSLVKINGHRRLIGSHIDITDRVLAEDSLRIRDRAIQSVTQGILVTDATQPHNPIIFASSGFERLTGYTNAEVLGWNCRFLQGPKTDQTELDKLREALRTGRPCTVVLLNYRKDGTTFWNELSVSPVRDNAGRLTHFVGVQADITERRSLEEQLRQSQKMEAIGQLAGGVAHDFNNLLTVINGYSDLLAEQLSPDDPMQELVIEIGRAGERAGALTRQLLAFSRRQVLDLRILNLNVVVSDAEKLLRRLIGEDVVLTTVLASNLASVKVDAGQVEQILLNLAVNARDAMPQGGHLTIETRNVTLDEVYCSLRADVHPGEYVLVAVSDTGHGMDERTQAKIFEPFFTTKEQGKGTGLGLATVHGIVRQSGGHVAVYSEVGRGTTFKVYLPQVAGQPLSGKSNSGVRPMPRGTETVLMVEDEDSVRALGRHILQSCGYTVLEASDGLHALEVSTAHTGPIHLLISDVVMPNLGGRQLAVKMREARPECLILFLSGYTDDAVIRHGILEAEFAFLQKPYTPSLLASKVRSVLDGAQ